MTKYKELLDWQSSNITRLRHSISFWREIEKPIISYLIHIKLDSEGLKKLLSKIKHSSCEEEVTQNFNYNNYFNEEHFSQAYINKINLIYKSLKFKGFAYSFEKWHDIVNNTNTKNTEKYEAEFIKLAERFKLYSWVNNEFKLWDFVGIYKTFNEMSQQHAVIEYTKLYKDLINSYQYLSSVTNLKVMKLNNNQSTNNEEKVFYNSIVNLLVAFAKNTFSQLIIEQQFLYWIDAINKELIYEAVAELKKWQQKHHRNVPAWHIVSSEISNILPKDVKYSPVIWSDNKKLQKWISNYELPCNKYNFNFKEKTNSQTLLSNNQSENVQEPNVSASQQTNIF